MSSLTGFLYIHKPPGMTSHDVVDAIRKTTGQERVGHAGTLDPFAEGLLVVGIGREATRKLGIFLRQLKTYRAIVKLGAVSSTDDPEGKITPVACEPPLATAVRATVKKFLGEIEQIPPAYSAIKLKGKKAYEFARAGIEPELKPRRVHIHRLEIVGYEYPELEFEAEVSSGTYIRALGRDIGNALGCGGYLTKLERLKIGDVKLEDAIPLQTLSKENWHLYLHPVTTRTPLPSGWGGGKNP